MEYRIRSILKYSIDIDKVLGHKGSRTLKALRIYQYSITSICDILPQKIPEFEPLQVVHSILQISTRIGKKNGHGDNIDLRYGCCQ